MQNAASDFSLPKIQRSTFVRNYSMNLQSEQVYVYGFLPTFRNSAANQYTIVGIVHVHIYILLTVCMYKYNVVHCMFTTITFGSINCNVERVQRCTCTSGSTALQRTFVQRCTAEFVQLIFSRCTAKFGHLAESTFD